MFHSVRPAHAVCSQRWPCSRSRGGSFRNADCRALSFPASAIPQKKASGKRDGPEIHGLPLVITYEPWSEQVALHARSTALLLLMFTDSFRHKREHSVNNELYGRPLASELAARR